MNRSIPGCDATPVDIQAVREAGQTMRGAIQKMTPEQKEAYVKSRTANLDQRTQQTLLKLL